MCWLPACMPALPACWLTSRARAGMACERMRMHACMCAQVHAAGHISALALSPRGNRLVANCSDRCARLLEVLPPAPDHPRFSPAEAAGRIRAAKVRTILHAAPGLHAV